MSAGEIILEWVFPLAGGIVGMMLFTVPLRAVLHARREKSLGVLNPVPFAAQTATTAGWIAYAYVLEDRQAGALIYWYVKMPPPPPRPSHSNPLPSPTFAGPTSWDSAWASSSHYRATAWPVQRPVTVS